MIMTKEIAMLALKAFKERREFDLGEYSLSSDGDDVIFQSMVMNYPHFRYSSKLNDFEELDDQFNPCQPVKLIDFSKF